MATRREVTVKKRCCKSDPRCQRCPVVAKRLSAVGLAQRTGKRTYVLDAPKKAIKRARRFRAKKITLTE
ncbi:hypothetical protein DSM104299_02717 [Baekduia alba]|uniref:hypothetical protein n=1 Tax=Baekduia alba TaxID=2997333 RepID=UPI002340DCE2|nr:hypothetical protein [Baekduia alba]WCB93989.1 hypothetical protein DSM104299_02717 [Baekduia alba]